MNLFLAAGIDIPSSGSGGKRSAPRLPRLPLFVEKTVERALTIKAIEPTDKQIALAKKYAKNIKSAAFLKQKETQVRNNFFDEILKGVLGYKGYCGDAEYSLAFEHMLRRKPVDTALGRFFPDAVGDQVVAPFEMKGPDTADLDKIMPGRGISPVQQAWDYAADAPGAKWVLVSNCLEIRLYRFGRGREAYELFDLSRLDEADELKRLLLILDAGRLIGADTEALLGESDAALKDVTNQLYVDYRKLRGELVAFLTESRPRQGAAAFGRHPRRSASGGKDAVGLVGAKPLQDDLSADGRAAAGGRSSAILLPVRAGMGAAESGVGHAGERRDGGDHRGDDSTTARVVAAPNFVAMRRRKRYIRLEFPNFGGLTTARARDAGEREDIF
jgi:hypothetical protein